MNLLHKNTFCFTFGVDFTDEHFGVEVISGTKVDLQNYNNIKFLILMLLIL